MFEALLAEENLPTAYLRTVSSVWAPLAERCAALAERSKRPVILGLCGAQGSGKSTAAKVLVELMQARGLAAAVLSIDDLYLSHVARAELARTVHPLLATRGPPGTHDVALGRRVLEAVQESQAVRLPRFDKAVDDPEPADRWPLSGPLDVLIFEGWCVGARPQGPGALVEAINTLERDEDPKGSWRRWCNDALRGYQDLFSRIDCLVLLKAPSFDVVRRWRGEQEAKLRERVGEAAGSRTMTEAQLDRFVQHYERLTRHILATMPDYADVVVELGEDRQPRDLTSTRAPRAG